MWLLRELLGPPADRAAGVAAQRFGPVRAFAVGVHRFAARLSAFAQVRLICQQRQRPLAVVVGPQRLAWGRDTPQEDAARCRPGPCGLDLAPELYGFVETARKVGTLVSPTWAIHAAPHMSLRCLWFSTSDSSST